MIEKEFADTLWICLYTDDTGIGIVGVFSSEETALAALPETNDNGGQYWLCPADKDIRVGSDGDRFNDLPDRVYPVFTVEIKPIPKTKTKLRVVK